MKFVDQIVFEDKKGDCLRACLASIFEFEIEGMPNFWEQTDCAPEFWDLVNKWMVENLDYKCIPIILEGDFDPIIDDVLCIAIGRVSRINEQHAVVWCNKLIFDPHPERKGLVGNPESYVLLVPINPKKIQD
jgi:hypothetical protein